MLCNASLLITQTTASTRSGTVHSPTWVATRSSQLTLGRTCQLLQMHERIDGGATESAGLANDGPSKSREWKMQDWNLADQIAGLENAGLENAEPENAGQNVFDF